MNQLINETPTIKAQRLGVPLITRDAETIIGVCGCCGKDATKATKPCDKGGCPITEQKELLLG